MFHLQQIDHLSKIYEKVMRSVRIMRAATASLFSTVVTSLLVFPMVLLALGPEQLFKLLLISIGITVFFILVTLLYVGTFKEILLGDQRTIRRILFFLNLSFGILIITFLIQVFSALEEPHLLLLAAVSFAFSVGFIFLFRQGLIEMVRKSNEKRLPLLLYTGPSKDFKIDLYRILGINTSEYNLLKKTLKARFLGLLVLWLEGSVYYVYFRLPSRFSNIQTRLQEQEESGALESPLAMIFLVIFMLTVAFVSTQLFFYIARRVRNKLRRSLIQSAKVLTESDQRAPILFLRSFRNDHIDLKNAKIPWHTRIFDPGTQAGTLEELIVQNYSLLGPVIGLGNPDDPTPPIGVARDYVSHQNWKAQILSFMDQASTIVIGMGQTDSLFWEIQQIKELGYLNKTTFFFPPIQEENLVILDKLFLNLQLSKESIQDYERLHDNNHHLLSLKFDDQQNGTITYSQKLTELEYEVAIRVAITT